MRNEMLKIIYSSILLSALVSCALPISQQTENSREIANAKDDCLSLVDAVLAKAETKILKKITKNLVGTNYKITGNELYFKSELVGKIETIHPRYLFEWQDEESHKYWVQNGKISREEMDLYLEDRPQTYGRGYYVSLSPTDSSSYGSHLTVFTVNSPMVILKAKNNFSSIEERVKELRDFGFAGFRGTDTWLNIINENYLTEATALQKNFTRDLLEDDSRVAPFLVEDLIKKPSIEAIAPQLTSLKEGAIAKFQSKKALNKLETNLVLGHIKNNPSLMNDFLSDETYIKSFFNLLNAKQLGFFYKMGSIERINMVAAIKKLFAKLSYPKSFFGLYDLQDLAKAETAGQLKKLVKAATDEDALLDSVDFKNIKNGDDFTHVLNQIYGREFNIRSSSESVTYDLTSRSSDLYRNSIWDISIDESDSNIMHVTAKSFDPRKVVGILYSIHDRSYLDGILARTGDEKAKNKKIIELFFNALFDRNNFRTWAAASNRDTAVTIDSLYKAFISVNPYGEKDSVAGRLYYRWLVSNFYHLEFPVPKVLSHQAEIFGPNVEVQNNDEMLAWYLTRLWVLSGSNAAEISRRAQEVSSFDSVYQNYFEKFPFIRK